MFKSRNVSSLLKALQWLSRDESNSLSCKNPCLVLLKCMSLFLQRHNDWDNFKLYFGLLVYTCVSVYVCVWGGSVFIFMMQRMSYANPQLLNAIHSNFITILGKIVKT